MKWRLLDLFSGQGGISLGLERSGYFETVAFCEKDPICHRVLKAHWPYIPIYDDVKTLSRKTLHADGIEPDFICGGFPCQDASFANAEGTGTAGNRTGLFVEAVRLAGELGCPILMENVSGLFKRGFGDVLRALAEIGFDAEWEVIRADSVGADHERERVFILAYPSSEGRQGFESLRGILGIAAAKIAIHDHHPFEPWRTLVAGQYPLRSGDGLSLGMERARIRLCGNAVVPRIPEIIGRAIGPK